MGKWQKCRKINDCYKIQVLLDKDLLSFQHLEAAEEICNACEEFAPLFEAEFPSTFAGDVGPNPHPELDQALEG